ncbi:prephenate dehydrogenase [Granulicella sibirica]|uniref:Prephenate and/or arogenate dehydrogenase n=1 Tax=Granulicella sibirica TaxID=2479048 RepID=A0A4Q0T845_9BACT|nr:prephenate dehydrogenase/arogenate dehydrogenase family protein [Granulicella sibirica]RXH58308.1 Prephenate and/or arogenate dehydrogenase [Granulicella sibirica]
MIERVVIVGTGLIGSSIGLALRAAGFSGLISGVDLSEEELRQALAMGAIGEALEGEERVLEAVTAADVIMLAVPVLGILDWMQRLAPLLGPGQLVTDVGSTKGSIAELAGRLYNGDGQARFLPGHPMAGKESGGAALAEARLLNGATWLFTALPGAASELEVEWQDWVRRFGCRVVEMEAGRHDVVCAWVSHLPQYVSTAMAALLEDEFREAPEVAGEFLAIGGRALREMTRLGASPYSMWRDVAMTNTDAVAATLLALEQRLAHLRENLRTPELRDEFARANAFRKR